MERNDSDPGRVHRRPTEAGPPPWYEPLGSPESGRRLTRLVVARAAAHREPALTVDFDRGVVFTHDRRWVAGLSQLAAQASATAPSDWPDVVDREIRKWRRAATAARRQSVDPAFGGRTHDPAAKGHDHRPTAALIRLTHRVSAVGPFVRPAFGPVVWEALHDLGAAGVAAPIGEPTRRPAQPSEAVWARIATETVDRYRPRWAHLPVEAGLGAVLSGPHVSALLFDPRRLRAHLGPAVSGTELFTTVVSNSLVLILFGRTAEPPHLERLIESLLRFAADRLDSFEPFTTMVDGCADPIDPGST